MSLRNSHQFRLFLATFLDQLGVTQHRYAEVAKVSPATVSKVLTGRTSSIDPETRDKLKAGLVTLLQGHEQGQELLPQIERGFGGLNLVPILRKSAFGVEAAAILMAAEILKELASESPEMRRKVIALLNQAMEDEPE